MFPSSVWPGNWSPRNEFSWRSNWHQGKKMSFCDRVRSRFESKSRINQGKGWFMASECFIKADVEYFRWMSLKNRHLIYIWKPVWSGMPILSVRLWKMFQWNPTKYLHKGFRCENEVSQKFRYMGITWNISVYRNGPLSTRYRSRP